MSLKPNVSRQGHPPSSEFYGASVLQVIGRLRPLHCLLTSVWVAMPLKSSFDQSDKESGLTRAAFEFLIIPGGCWKFREEHPERRISPFNLPVDLKYTAPQT